MLRTSRHLRVEHGNRPKPGREPGVEHVIVLMKVGRRKSRILLLSHFQSLVRRRCDNESPVRQIVCRYTLSPPELAGDAPVVRGLHPVAIGVAVFFRNELYPPAFDAFERRFRKGVHLEEPLLRKFRFYDSVRPFRIAYRRGVILCLFEVSRFLKHLGYFLSRHEAVFAHENLSLFVQAAVVIDDVENRQIVAHPYRIVVHVVSRRNLEAASSEIHLDIGILDNRYFLINQRDNHLLSAKPVISRVGRIDADRSIGHNRFRTGRRHDDVLVGGIPVSVGDEVSHMVELAGGVLVDNFLIADRSKSDRVPVDHSHSPVYQTLVVEIDESVDHRLAQIRVHRELRPVPVAGRSELAELAEDDAAVFLLPLPRVFHELVAGEILFVYALGLEFRHDLAFGRYRGVVGSRNPAGVLPVHTGLAYEHIVDCVVENVPHMEYPRHIRRRDDYGVGFPFVRF